MEKLRERTSSMAALTGGHGPAVEHREPLNANAQGHGKAKEGELGFLFRHLSRPFFEFLSVVKHPLLLASLCFVQ